jgi:hypothetical protein
MFHGLPDETVDTYDVDSDSDAASSTTSAEIDMFDPRSIFEYRIQRSQAPRIDPYSQKNLLDELEMEELFTQMENAPKEDPLLTEAEDLQELAVFKRWLQIDKTEALNSTLEMAVYTPVGRKEALTVFECYLTREIGLTILHMAGSVLEVPFPYPRVPRLLLPAEVLTSFQNTMEVVETLRYQQVRVGQMCYHIVRRDSIDDISGDYCWGCGELCFPYYEAHPFKCKCSKLGDLGHKATLLRGSRKGRIVGGFCYECTKTNKRFLSAMATAIGVTVDIGFD